MIIISGHFGKPSRNMKALKFRIYFHILHKLTSLDSREVLLLIVQCNSTGNDLMKKNSCDSYWVLSGPAIGLCSGNRKKMRLLPLRKVDHSASPAHC